MSQIHHIEGTPIGTRGGISVVNVFPADGEYVLRTRAFADQAGNETAKLALKIAGKDVRVFEVKGTSASDAGFCRYALADL